MDLPSGTILMWASNSPIPTGWTILDTGYHIKPIKGFSSSYDNFSQTSPVAYAGASHSHSFTSPSVSGGVSHNHGEKNMNLITNSTAPADGSYSAYYHQSSASGDHSHSITISTANTTNSHVHTLTLNVGGASTIPAYKTIVLIRKN